MAANWQIGDKIQNRWEIYKILKGGMGIVYIVYDHELHDAFAAKTFQDEVFARNPQTAERFTQEALTWVNLDLHPNVTEARFVENIQGKPFLFLEYVSGGDLGGWIGTPRLTENLEQVLRFAIQFCDGMNYALSRGIEVHRDIKPQNCLVTQDNTLKVTDFGLAKILDAATAPDSVDGQSVGRGEGSSLPGLNWDAPISDANIPRGVVLSPSGGAAGTCTHMAPEQFENAKGVDVRADIYSFGVMLFQMITGKLPFDGKSWEEFERLHKNQTPPKLSTQHPTLNALVAACLSKDSASRPANFGSVREQLAEIYQKLAGEPAPEPIGRLDLSAVYWNNKGVSLAALGRTEEALECFERAIHLNPSDEGTWSNKGVNLAKLGQREAALGCYNKALQLNSRYEQAWVNKGVSLAALERREEALGCYDRAIQINPYDEQAWNNKGVSLAALGRRQEALECYDRALQLNPQFEQAWSNKGNSLASLERREEALESYDRALQLNPRLEQAWFNKGVTLAELGRKEEAMECFDRALQLNPGFEEAWYYKGLSLAALGRREEAVECFDRAIHLNPSDGETWFRKGVNLAALERMEESLECFDRAIQINPRDEKAWSNKGSSLAELGRREEAIDCYDKAIEIDPHLVEASFNKGLSLAALGRRVEALECYDRALQLNPLFEQAWYNKGAALGNSDRLQEALACFVQAQRLGHPRAAEAIARCRQLLGT